MTHTIELHKKDFKQMFSFAKSMQKLMLNPAYQATRQGNLVVSKKPAYESMLMGYDFHTQEGLPQLIEINNNAGGLFLAQHGKWLAQPITRLLPDTLEARLIAMFAKKDQSIAIVDEEVQQQYMYPEMQAYATLLRDAGRQVFILSPEQLDTEADGSLSHQGVKIDMIYNRHTDFYLESAAMQAICTAYLNDQVVLNPHPQSYELLGDKGRMVDWHRPHFLESFLSTEAASAVRAMIPLTRYVQEQNLEQLWKERKQWVFKPTASHAGKGVVLGKSITRKRFAQLDQPNMIMQAFVPPAQVTLNDVRYKTDFRLYMHGQQLIAVAGRIYQGMLTNFRTEGSGFVGVKLV